MQMGVLDKLVMYWDEETMVQSPDFAAVWDEVADKEWYNLVTPDDATSTVWTAFSNSRRYNGLYTMTAWIGGSAAETMETQERASNEASIVEEVVANLRTMFATNVVYPRNICSRIGGRIHIRVVRIRTSRSGPIIRNLPNN